MDHPRLMVICALLIATAIGSLVNLHKLHKWERDAGFPFGRYCDVMPCPLG